MILNFKRKSNLIRNKIKMKLKSLNKVEVVLFFRGGDMVLATNLIELINHLN